MIYVGFDDSMLIYNYHNSEYYPLPCLLFKTQLNSYLTGNTLRLRYEPNTLMLSTGL
jgi:hypothetical protein